MFRHILVPLDGLPCAERAIPVAARLARASGGTVVLLRVVRLATDFVLYPAADPRTIQTIIDADFEEANWNKTTMTEVERERPITGTQPRG